MSYRIWQGGIAVAWSDSKKEIMHYAMMYLDDGDLEIQEKKGSRWTTVMRFTNEGTKMSDDENKVVNIFTKQAEQGGVTFGHIEPATVLNAAIEANVKEVLVLGWDEDGAFYIASSEGYTPDLITLCEIGKSTLLSGYEA